MLWDFLLLNRSQSPRSNNRVKVDLFFDHVSKNDQPQDILSFIRPQPTKHCLKSPEINQPEGLLENLKTNVQDLLHRSVLVKLGTTNPAALTFFFNLIIDETGLFFWEIIHLKGCCDL